MIASVSTFSRSIGATRPLSKVNFCMGALLLVGGAFECAPCPLDVLAYALDGVASAQQQGGRQGGGGGGVFLHGGLLQASWRMSKKGPCTAAAAAMAGLTRWVRPPAPWRPSKLRLLVDAQRSPGSRRSAFMARHMLQPGSRHSKPAATKILSRPSRSACSLTRPEPGTTMASFTLLATLRPRFLTTAAASRMSSMRLLVQLPMNTLSMVMSLIALPGCRPMQVKARSMAPRLLASFSLSGSGTRASTPSTISGDVPQVTCGTMSAAPSFTTVSNLASGSECSVCQYATAWSHSTPVGDRGRPLTYSMVLSSTATRPARAPPSMAMLHTVMRPSMLIARKTEPANSMV